MGKKVSIIKGGLVPGGWGSLGCLLPPGSTCLAPAVPLRTVADSLSPKASICVSLQSILVAVVQKHQKSFSLSPALTAAGQYVSSAAAAAAEVKLGGATEI